MHVTASGTSKLCDIEVNAMETSVIVSGSTVTPVSDPAPKRMPSAELQYPARIRTVYTPVSTERVAVLFDGSKSVEITNISLYTSIS
jgi:hypothetical protein